MEARALKAKQTDDDQKQKLESKEEKAAQLKMKLQVETQEKAERWILFKNSVLKLLIFIYW